MDEEVLLKIKNLITERERIDRELEAIIVGGDRPKRGRPRKEMSAASNTMSAGRSVTCGDSHTVVKVDGAAGA